MEQQRPRIIRSACIGVRVTGSLDGDVAQATQVTRTLGAFVLPGSIERTDTGLLCVRRRLVAPRRRLLGASEAMGSVVTRYGRS